MNRIEQIGMMTCVKSVGNFVEGDYCYMMRHVLWNDRISLYPQTLSGPARYVVLDSEEEVNEHFQPKFKNQEERDEFIESGDPKWFFQPQPST